MNFVLYTDGSAYVADETGAWAYAIIDPDSNTLIRSDAQFVKPTTNNRMEIQAVLEGLKQFRPDTPVEVVSDSAYVINCFKAKWYVKWERNNWWASSGPVKNVDLWRALLTVVRKRTASTVWTHVRGHAGNRWNDYCDKLCDKVRRAGVNPPDE